MTRRRKPIHAYGVFNPRGVLLTCRDNRADAEFAARVLVGTGWESAGYKIDPIAVTRVPESAHATTTHPDMIEE